jgi:hypothetical protein
MSVNNRQLDPTDTRETATDHAREIYERLLALSNRVSAAYLDAYEEAASGIGEFQNTVATASDSDSLDRGADQQTGTPTADTYDPAREAGERAFEVSENLLDMSKQVTLACVNACEVAALALAECQVEVAAPGDLDLVKTVGDAHADLTRQVTEAYTSSARELVKAGA